MYVSPYLVYDRDLRNQSFKIHSPTSGYHWHNFQSPISLLEKEYNFYF
jgi:hypothetical protein